MNGRSIPTRSQRGLLPLGLSRPAGRAVGPRIQLAAIAWLLGAPLLLIPASARAKERSTEPTSQELIPPAALEPIRDPSRLRFPPVGSIPDVQADRFELPNGLVVYLARDAEFPDLAGSILIHAGSEVDPPSKTGLARLVATVLRSGGTAKVSGDSLDARLESIGARIETSTDETSTSASFYCLKDQGAEVLGLLADLLERPALPETKLDLAKVQTRRAIAARNDETGGIARRVIRQLVWGKDSPYARETEYATLDAIGGSDLKDFHDNYYAPDHAILTIWGDLDPAVMKEQITTLFGGWARSGRPLPSEPPAPAAGQSGGDYYVPKEKVTQSYILLGEAGIKADNPDFPALEILGEILGGGFSSRMLNDIRTQRGLAYAVGAGGGVGYAHPGIFTAYAMTRSDSTLVTLGLVQGELRRIVQAAPSNDEVRRARESLLNSFVFNYATRGQVVNRRAFYEFYGYPSDFLATYQDRLGNVTAADVHRVAQTYIHPDQMKTLIVGDEKSFAAPLSSAGKFETVDVSIPGTPGP